MQDVDGVQPGARIKVIGVGGGGGNAVNTMIAAGLQGVDFMTANTDCAGAEREPRVREAPARRPPSPRARRRRQSRRRPQGRDRRRRAHRARSSTGADMVFVTAGMGGGTGTGGAPVVAQVAQRARRLTVGVVTKPFHFEGQEAQAAGRRAACAS